MFRQERNSNTAGVKGERSELEHRQGVKNNVPLGTEFEHRQGVKNNVPLGTEFEHRQGVKNNVPLGTEFEHRQVRKGVTGNYTELRVLRGFA
jgi:hypothetical protein